MSFTYEHERPSITSDMVILLDRGFNDFDIVMVRRAKDPYAGKLALPVGFMEMNETVYQAATRKSLEEIGLNLKNHDVHFVGYFDAVDRDPRGRVVSFAFSTLIDQETASKIIINEESTEYRLVSVDEFFISGTEFAFDHKEIVRKAIKNYLR